MENFYYELNSKDNFDSAIINSKKENYGFFAFNGDLYYGEKLIDKLSNF